WARSLRTLRGSCCSPMSKLLPFDDFGECSSPSLDSRVSSSSSSLRLSLIDLLIGDGNLRPLLCYSLASLSNVLQHQHQSMNTAADMLLNLKELFGHQSRAARREAMRVLMNMTMREGTPVREHVIAMMAQLNELEVLGAFIDGETQVDIVLQS
ncbi:Unknown protein, partial [Striga hermonthica]